MDYFDTVIPVLLSFSISVILCPIVIPFLKWLKFGQYVRDDGPKSHLKKAGTPTMGGLIILISVVVTSSLYLRDYPEILPVIFATVGFGLIGFLDDYIKIVMRRSLGLRAWQKLVLQLLVTIIFVYYYTQRLHYEMQMLIPFTGGIASGRYIVLPGWLFIPFLFFVMVGTVNGTNFTDGLDGLASSVTLLIAVFFTVVAIGTGGFVASTALLLKMPLYILIVGMIYLVEVLSVILQVGYFKITHGRRIFKMAPIHHHFEQSGWSETKVVAVFSIVTALFCLIALAAL